MEVANTIAYYDTATITAVTSFIVQALGLPSVKNGLAYRLFQMSGEIVSKIIATVVNVLGIAALVVGHYQTRCKCYKPF
jgi:hypothetical protein